MKAKKEVKRGMHVNGHELGIATGVFLGLNILSMSIAGAFVFGEQLGLTRAFGLFALAASIIFIEVMG